MSSIQIILNSNDCIEYLNGSKCSHLLFSTPLIEKDTNTNILLSVIQCTIPYSFYQINETNNEIKYIIHNLDPSDDIVQIKKLTVGNYTINDLKIELENLMGQQFIIKYNTVQNKLIFIHNEKDFSILATSSSAYNILGFTEDMNHKSKDRTLISNSIVNLINIKCINIESEYISENITLKNNNNMRTLVVIPINVAPYSIINYVNLLQHKINLYNFSFSTITIKLKDQDGNFLDMNNQTFTMIIQLDYENI